VLALPASGEEPYRAGYLSLMAPGGPPVPDRAQIHAQINPEILDFFNRTLGLD